MGVFTITSSQLVLASCGTTALSSTGVEGIYEAEMSIGSGTGIVTLDYLAGSFPDRFQIEYDGAIVADSKFVGSNVASSSPTSSYPGLVATHVGLPILNYNGTTYIDTGNDVDLVVSASDVANGTTEPAVGIGSISFNKLSAGPSTMKIIVTSLLGGVAWNISPIACPS